MDQFFIMTEDGEFVPSDPAGAWVYNTTHRNPDVTIYGDGQNLNKAAYWQFTIKGDKFVTQTVAKAIPKN